MKLTENPNPSLLLIKLLIVIVAFLDSPLSHGQNPIYRNSYKSNRSVIKLPDTLTMKNYNLTKVDTLYFKNVNPEQKEKIGFWVQTLPILGVLLGGALAIFGQYFIKKLEKKVSRDNLKEGKRVEHLEVISSKINDLSLHDPTDSQIILDSISDLRSYIFRNNLYIEKKYETIFNQIGDYYNEVANNHRNKDIAKETEYWNQFKRLFTS